ncbi:mucin-5AC-like [Drosophila serrata]|uniref:mucin-5AC-like n=1 Tax=Drosophila serrata TaxID=7274 RepID=UPI000A1D18D0|nr:mucin-5AC-like [Drosophila serrata]
MSSYRSYTPWKTSLGSSYKPTSSSYGSTGDSTSRYTSLATPSAYRPSFSGGTYRLKRDPPPSTASTTPVTSYVSRYAKTDPKETAPSERTSPVKRYTGASTSSLGKYGRSRDPSPVALEHTNRNKSRDPSPVIDSARSKLGATYRGGNTASSSSSSASRNGYSSRYGGTTSRISGNGSAISYLTTSDFHARTASRAKASREREREKEKELEIEEKPSEVVSQGKEKSIEKQLEEQTTTNNEADIPETFISISVVTRATSPTLPGSTTVQRTRRIDPAKTIEKTIQRSTKRRPTVDQEIQSDRMDDSTRYLRYSAGGSSLSSTYSPHRDRISSLRYSASPHSSGSGKSSPLSEGKLSQPIPEAVSPARTNGSVSSAKSSEALSPSRTNGNVSSAKSSEALSPPRSNGSSKSPEAVSPARTNGSVSSARSTEALSPPRSNGCSPKSLEAVSPPRSNSSSKSTKSKLSPPKAVRLNSRQSSVENLVNKPPAPPSKADSPTKTCSSSSGSSAVKWPNKDFRKSSLNVGPTDRPRKSRTPSSGGESEDLPNGSSLERSPSAGSEGSLASGGSSKKSSKLSNGKISGAAGTKPKAHKSCSDSTTGNSSSATASASDSDQQRVKSVKKQAKKKTTAGKVAAAHKPIGTTTAAESPPPVVVEVVPATQTRLKKLSAVSNFFASRQQDANNEPIFLESSESSGEPEALSLPVISGFSKISKISANSLTTDLRTNEPRTTPSSEANPTSPITNSLSSSTRCPRETTTGTGSGTRLPTTTISTRDTQDTSLTTTASLTTSEQDEPSWWQDTSLQINTASALDHNNRTEMPPYRLRHIDSGEEQAWWLQRDENGDDDDTLAEETLNTLDDDAQEVSKGTWWSQEEQDSSSSQVKAMPRSRLSPEKDAWWLQEEEGHKSPRENGDLNNNNNNIEPHVEVTLKLPSNGSRSSKSRGASKSSNGSSKGGGSNPWWLSGPAKKLFNVQRVESGERAWWQEQPEEQAQEEKENEPPPVKPPTPPPRIIKHWESGERAWWLQDEPEASKLPEAVSSDDEEQAVSRDEVDLRQSHGQPLADVPHELSSSFDFNAYSERPVPLGQCASPVRCPSPYDNIPRSKVQEPTLPLPPTLTPTHSHSLTPPYTLPTLQPRFSPQTRRAGEKLFISRHQNIDELLGGACRPLSPLFYSNPNPAESELTPLASKNMFLLEEVTPDQVRIHDSTAQLPVIQRMQRDVEWLENGSSFYEPPKQQQQSQHQQLQQQQQQRRADCKRFGSLPVLLRYRRLHFGLFIQIT